jgi:hypothetical protein
MFLSKKYNHLLLDLFVKIKMTIFHYFFLKKPHISKILVFFIYILIGHDVQRETLSQIPSILGCLQHVNNRACSIHARKAHCWQLNVVYVGSIYMQVWWQYLHYFRYFSFMQLYLVSICTWSCYLSNHNDYQCKQLLF